MDQAPAPGVISIGTHPYTLALSVGAQGVVSTSMQAKQVDGTKGNPGRMPMPGFKAKLSEEQRWGLVNYVRTFAGKGKGAPSKK